jgi:nucleoid DNA-binding protein
MKKALLMAMSGALIGLTSFNALADNVNQRAMETSYIAVHGGNSSEIHNKFQAWETVLKAELAAKHTVKIDGIGTFKARELNGTRTYKLEGQILTANKYTLVPNATTTGTTEFLHKMALAGNMSDAEAAQINEHYRSEILKSLKTGQDASIYGVGAFARSKRPAYSSTNAAGVVTHHSARFIERFRTSKASGIHTRFVVDACTQKQLNNQTC